VEITVKQQNVLPLSRHILQNRSNISMPRVANEQQFRVKGHQLLQGFQY
jgi:hypothetical protein